jgi:hypothetical protein
MIAEEFVQMSNCNLNEFIHNKWLQASGNKDGNLYVTTVDDHIRAALQVVAYHQFLKGDVGGDGPSKENSSFDALNQLVTPLSYRRFSSTYLVGTNYVLKFSPSRVPRFSAYRNASPTSQLELTIKPTAPTLSLSLAFVSLKEPQDLTLHFCLQSLSNLSRHCSRFHHPFH